MQLDIKQLVHPTLDAASFGVVVGTLTNLLPPIAASVTILWIGINIYERVTGNKISEMYQKWRGKK